MKIIGVVVLALQVANRIFFCVCKYDIGIKRNIKQYKAAQEK
jgi:hypothetical protein